MVGWKDLIECICILGWAFITMQVYCFFASAGKGSDRQVRDGTKLIQTLQLNYWSTTFCLLPLTLLICIANWNPDMAFLQSMMPYHRLSPHYNRIELCCQW